MHTRSFVLMTLACAVLLASCRRSQTVVSGEDESATPEVSWSDQIEAVRAAETNAIVVVHSTVTDAMLAQLRGVSGLRILEVERADVTAKGLEILRELRELERLKLVGAAVDDQGAESIAALSGLQILNLPDALISDRGAEQLAGLRRLQLLRLGSPLVTDKGLEHIGRMDQLRFLHLIGVAITDEGLHSLYGLQGLESFYLDAADQVSDEALAELRRALPGLHIHRDQQHLQGDSADHDHR